MIPHQQPNNRRKQQHGKDTWHTYTWSMLITPNMDLSYPISIWNTIWANSVSKNISRSKIDGTKDGINRRLIKRHKEETDHISNKNKTISELTFAQTEGVSMLIKGYTKDRMAYQQY